MEEYSWSYLGSSQDDHSVVENQTFDFVLGRTVGQCPGCRAKVIFNDKPQDRCPSCNQSITWSDGSHCLHG